MEKKSDRKFKAGNISLILESYNDIFSDFDPRPYTVRALSDDFLNECRKAIIEKGENIELRFLLSKKQRNFSDEQKIKKRLRQHFQKHYLQKHKEIKRIKRSGILWFFLGAILMFLGTFLYKMEGFFFNFLFILTEPAGWFFFWVGLEKIFITSKTKVPEYTFYKKMSSAEIYFSDY
jgi:hypothetical protein